MTYIAPDGTEWPHWLAWQEDFLDKRLRESGLELVGIKGFITSVRTKPSNLPPARCPRVQAEGFDVTTDFVSGMYFSWNSCMNAAVRYFKQTGQKCMVCRIDSRWNDFYYVCVRLSAYKQKRI